MLSSSYLLGLWCIYSPILKKYKEKKKIAANITNLVNPNIYSLPQTDFSQVIPINSQKPKISSTDMS